MLARSKNKPPQNSPSDPTVESLLTSGLPGGSALKKTPHATTEVMREVVRGEGKALSALAKLVPAGRGTGRANPATLWRWCFEGVKLPDGSRLRLEACQLGGRLLSSEEALARFLAGQNASPAPSQPTTAPAEVAPPPKARKRREAEVAQAESELDALGI